jgi:hypothetical protein
MNDYDIEDNDIVQQTTTKPEWEIIYRLHHSQIMQISKMDMLGRRDIGK